MYSSVGSRMEFERSQIQSFFQNQTVFITGGSGFFGKVLIEKLLRDCEDIGKIYVLMREKKGKTSEERFKELFNYPCFDRLKSERAECINKVSLINGDLHQPLLGISDQDIDILTKEATCVIHAAANVKFDQSFKEASYGLKATGDVLELAKKMLNLKVFVFVSTAYSNCIQPHIKEEFYEPPMKAESLLKLVNVLDEATLQAITPRLLGDWPNTYVYTKGITEDMIKSRCGNVPLIVVRPAIVVNSAHEPIPGWIDNVYGPMGMILGVGLGLVRSIHINPDVIAHLIPVDYACNCILAAAWKRATSTKNTIYNFVGAENNQLTWSGFMTKTSQFYWEFVSAHTVWYFCFQMRRYKTWHKICAFALHTVPAYMVDAILVCLRKPPMIVKTYRRLEKMLDSISFFGTRSWLFEDDNVTDLWNDMNESDKKLFYFKMDKLDWDEYYRNTLYGARNYLLKESMDTIPKAKRKAKLLFVAHYTLLALLYYLLYRFVMFVSGLFF